MGVRPRVCVRQLHPSPASRPPDHEAGGTERRGSRGSRQPAPQRHLSEALLAERPERPRTAEGGPAEPRTGESGSEGEGARGETGLGQQFVRQPTA